MIFAASQVGTPGPANLALMAAGARYGLVPVLPFVAGVALGKQLIIWPVGFGLMSYAVRYPWLFEALKWASVLYILWLAWRIVNLRLSEREGPASVPGFSAGLPVHPLNPKAWAMVTAAFTGFVTPDTPALTATALIAVIFLGLQVLLHPFWALAGARIARQVAGRQGERVLMWGLAAATVASVFYAVFAGGR